jgi:hypothetical protein
MEDPMRPHPPRHLVLAALVWCLTLAAPAPQTLAATPDDAAAAKALAADAAALARQGRYDEAAALYQQAYMMDPAPVLLFNLAYVHEKRGDSEAALDTYRRYLAAETDPSHREDAQKRVVAVEARLAAVPIREQPQPDDPAHVPERPPRRKDRTVMWALIGTGAAAVVAGGVVAAVLLTRDKGGPPAADGLWALPGAGGR